ncbi:hypothetical protein KIPB_001648 [Kipferlia bialata]|uniref:F5/8 type C domain-containing protein n=1 Tax=Kipferlia bialata TaxID=797122 RepID=A0A9K3CQA8_9EUKA|nr:hypothetical protein KIPB_001648 [Kipferlia bialata]|eukprot:g1648.t1
MEDCANSTANPLWVADAVCVEQVPEAPDLQCIEDAEDRQQMKADLASLQNSTEAAIKRARRLSLWAIGVAVCVSVGSVFAALVISLTVRETTDEYVLLTRLYSLSDEVATNTDSLAVLDGEMDSMTGSVASLDSVTSTMSSDLYSVTSTLSQEVGSHAVSLRDLEGEVDTMSDELDSMATSVSTLQVDAAVTERDISAVSASLSTVQTNVSGLQSDVSLLQSDVSGLTATVAGHTSSLASMSSDVSALDTSTDMLSSDISSISNTVAVHTSTLSTLGTDITTLEGTVSTLGTDITTLEGTDITTLEGTVSTLGTDVSTLEGSVSTLGTDITTLEGSVSTLGTDLSTLEGTVSTLDTTTATLSSSVSSLSLTVNTHDTQISTLDADMDTVQSDLGVLEVYADPNVTYSDAYTVLMDGVSVLAPNYIRHFTLRSTHDTADEALAAVTAYYTGVTVWETVEKDIADVRFTSVFIPSIAPIYDYGHSYTLRSHFADMLPHWAASVNEVGQGCTIVYSSPTVVCAVATAGTMSGNQHVTAYKIEYFDSASDGWLSVLSGTESFVGNEGAGIVLHTLSEPVVADRVRVSALTWSSHISMRLEVYGWQ